jgi:hypothetical protein
MVCFSAYYITYRSFFIMLKVHVYQFLLCENTLNTDYVMFQIELFINSFLVVCLLVAVCVNIVANVH